MKSESRKLVSDSTEIGESYLRLDSYSLEFALVHSKLGDQVYCQKTLNHSNAISSSKDLKLVGEYCFSKWKLPCRYYQTFKNLNISYIKKKKLKIAEQNNEPKEETPGKNQDTPG